MYICIDQSTLIDDLARAVFCGGGEGWQNMKFHHWSSTFLGIKTRPVKGPVPRSVKYYGYFQHGQMWKQRLLPQIIMSSPALSSLTTRFDAICPIGSLLNAITDQIVLALRKGLPFCRLLFHQLFRHMFDHILENLHEYSPKELYFMNIPQYPHKRNGQNIVQYLARFRT